jgi:hypothetical protein
MVKSKTALTMLSIDSVDQWYQERWSRFTASENYKLLIGGAKGEVFGTAAMTYIEQKALEMTSVMDERPELEEAKSLLHGRANEFPAFEAYVKATKNYDMLYCGSDKPVFLKYMPLERDCGGSPDGVVVAEGKDTFTADFGVEIKCPKNSLYHFRRLKWKDQWDIAQNYPLAYIQMQNLMMITGAQSWDFVSYDYRMKDKRLQTKIITCHKDKRTQDNLHFRLLRAIEERKKILQEHIGIL